MDHASSRVRCRKAQYWSAGPVSCLRRSARPSGSEHLEISVGRLQRRQRLRLVLYPRLALIVLPLMIVGLRSPPRQADTSSARATVAKMADRPGGGPGWGLGVTAAFLILSLFGHRSWASPTSSELLHRPSRHGRLAAQGVHALLASPLQIAAYHAAFIAATVSSSGAASSTASRLRRRFSCRSCRLARVVVSLFHAQGRRAGTFASCSPSISST